MLGSGAVVVIAEGTDLLAAATNVLRFFRNESCGKCVPCRVGSTKAHDPAPTRSSRRRARRRRRGRIVELEETMRLTSICGLGQVALGPGDQRAGHAARRRRGAHTRSRGRHRISEVRRDRSREFFTVRSVVAGAGRVPAVAADPHRDGSPARPRARPRCRPRRWRAPHALPGFARSTVDGYAVRAADTYGAVRGPAGATSTSRATVRDGPPPTSRCARARRWRSRPAGAPRRRRRGRHGRVHPGADARHDRGAAAGRAGRGRGASRRGRRASAPSSRPPAGRCAPRTSACSPPPASPRWRSTRRPRVAIVSTGDEVVPPDTATLEPRPGARRHRLGAGRAGPRGRRRATAARDRARRRASALAPSRCEAAVCTSCDVVVVSQPGRRSAPATRPPPRRRRWARPASGATGWRSSRQADAARRLRRSAGDRAAGQPASALVVFRLVGLPVVRLRRRHHRPAAGADHGGAVSRGLPRPPAASTSCRCAITATASPTPLFGCSALLSLLTAPTATSWSPRPPPARRGTDGRRDAVQVGWPLPAAVLATSPFISDVPAAEALPPGRRPAPPPAVPSGSRRRACRLPRRSGG